MFGAGEGVRGGRAEPSPGLVGVSIGSDAHLDFLLADPPRFLTPALWGTAAMAHLDTLTTVRLRLPTLKERFPYAPVVPPRFLPFRFNTYHEFDAFLEAHPDWLAANPWATGDVSEDEDDDDDDEEQD